MNKFSIWLTTALMICSFAQMTTLLAQDQTTDIWRKYVRITAAEADIHTQPDKQSIVVAQAKKDDIFRIYGTEGEWCETSLFEVETAYLHQSLVERVEEPKLQVSPEIRKNICVELEESRRRAVAQWQQDIKLGKTAGSYEYLTHYVDRYRLPIFRKFSIAPALTYELNCDEVLYRPLTWLDTVVFILIVIAPYVVIGALISVVMTRYRRAKAEESKSPATQEVLWKTFVLGTLMSTALFVIAFTILDPVLPWVIGDPLTRVSMAILGFSIVGCNLLVLHIDRKKINRYRFT